MSEEQKPEEQDSATLSIKVEWDTQNPIIRGWLGMLRDGLVFNDGEIVSNAMQRFVDNFPTVSDAVESVQKDQKLSEEEKESMDVIFKFIKEIKDDDIRKELSAAAANAMVYNTLQRFGRDAAMTDYFGDSEFAKLVEMGYIMNPDGTLSEAPSEEAMQQAMQDMFELDDDGNIVVDENGAPVLKAEFAKTMEDSMGVEKETPSEEPTQPSGRKPSKPAGP